MGSPPQRIKSSSSALIIENTPHKGRCFLASRDISPGEILIATPPYSIIPDSDAKPSLCACCLKNLAEVNKISSRFGHLNYCSDVCRRTDWEEYHQYESEFFKEFFTNDDSNAKGKNIMGWNDYTVDYMWLLLRVLIRKYRDLKEANHGDATLETKRNNDGLNFQDVWYLCSNEKEFSEEKIKEFTDVASVLEKFVKSLPPLSCSLNSESTPTTAPVNDENTFIRSLLEEAKVVHPHSVLPTTSPLHTLLTLLVCKEECNSFGLYNFTQHGASAPRQPYGLALYPTAVFFNHSCAPNVGHVNNGRDMVFYALDTIRKGEEACITYVSLSEGATDDTRLDSAVDMVHDLTGSKNQSNEVFIKSVLDRREGLHGVFHFQCDCKRCTVETEWIEQYRSSLSSGKPLSNPPFSSEFLKMLCRLRGCHGWFVPESLYSSIFGTVERRSEEVAEIGQKPQNWVCEGCERVVTSQ